jgi:hypothetical protein
MRTHVPGLLFLMSCVACGGGEKPPVVDPPTTGRLQGVAVLSGADNSEGVEVHLPGTELRTLTGPTGTWTGHRGAGAHGIPPVSLSTGLPHPFYTYAHAPTQDRSSALSRVAAHGSVQGSQADGARGE